MGAITALLGWFTWLFFISLAIYLVGFIFLIPPVLAIVFGIIAINSDRDERERRKGVVAICLGATGPFIGWFALLFFLMLKNNRTR